jgi:hypothetical protein
MGCGRAGVIHPTRPGESAEPTGLKEVIVNKTLRTALIALLAVPMWLLQPMPALAADGDSVFELISTQEAQREAAAEAAATPEMRTRGMRLPREDAPGISAVAAQPAGAASGPVRIEVAFRPAPGTRIVPSSFRVLYGLMKLDLTDRLKKNATVTEKGVVVERAQMPVGQHRLILQVTDDAGNTAEQELRIRVGAAS